MHALLHTACFVILSGVRRPGEALHLAATFITHLSKKRKTVFKSPNIMFKVLLTLGLFCLPSSPFSSTRREYLSNRKPPRQASMRRLVLVEKADSMVWTLALMGALLLTLAEPGFHPSLVSSLARITGLKLILREEIRPLFY